MSTIKIIYNVEPPFPATDQHPAAARYFVDGLYVDAVGGEPTVEEVRAYRYVQPIVDAAKFLDRLTDAEYVSLKSDLAFMRWFDKLLLMRMFGLDDAQSVKDDLVTRDLLTQERADELFAP